MPIVSKAQGRWAHWAAENAPEKTAKVAREFIQASPRGPGAYKHLPARVKKGKPKRSFGSLAVG
jgi:hypothetical protein